MKVIINIDGGSRGNPGIGAAAYVIKDESGKILAQEGHYMPHCTNNQAEYTALRLALIKAAELKAKELSIISDSLLLVKQYLGEYKIKNPDLAERMAEIRLLAKPFSIHIQHVLRHLNKEPDALANKAMDMKQSVGFNPIENLYPLVKTAKEDIKQTDAPPLSPVLRDEKGTIKKQKGMQQPSLFDEF